MGPFRPVPRGREASPPEVILSLTRRLFVVCPLVPGTVLGPEERDRHKPLPTEL